MRDAPDPDPARHPAEIAARLRAGEPVDVAWPGGRLRVERPQPTLFVARAGAETPLASLLVGQDSVLVGADETVDALAPAALAALAERFGRALLVELWVDGEAAGERDGVLVAPERGAPDRMMETFEHALARDAINHRPWRLGITVVDAVAPPGRAPLAPREGVYALGLALAPLWGEDGVTRPVALRDARRGLGRALREAAYDFGHRHARVGAPHVHALGRRDVTRAAFEADAALCAVGETYSLLLDVTPVNVPAARAAYRAGEGARAPDFHYRPLGLDPATMKRALWSVDLDPVEDPALHDLLASKREEIDREISLLAGRCGPRFLADALALFGGVDPGLRALARDLLAILPPPRAETAGADRTGAQTTGARVSVEALCARAEAEIAALKARDPSLAARVERRDDAAGLLVAKGDLLVGPDAAVTEGRLEALIQHEIGIHVVTRHNGARQPLRQLETGMAGYEETQEGLAVLAEYAVGGLGRGRLRLLAGRVLAVDALVDGAGFVEIVRLLAREHGFPGDVAFTVAVRVVRGGGLTKDAVYLRGFARVLERLAAGARLEDMLVGKIALDAWPVVEELAWRGVLAPPRLLPGFLDDPAARERLERARAGLDVRAIARACP
ncbi:tyrosine/phenylalanine carboxypeptidase domain-containing protein [Salinarimonas sp.]|uniref:tyrosine/phenylalanine carboxypeptidase domain-containing protein n=1 Tax=Salinarimonas sp. TaxID=2766526 RepID=UPI0032D8BDD2